MPAPAVSLPADLRTPALVLTDDPVPPAPREGVTVCAIDATPPREGGWASVTLALADETALRRVASTAALPPLGRARSVAVVLRSAVSPVALVPRPDWPPLRELDVRLLDGGALTRVELTKGVPVAEVLVALAQATGSRAVAGSGGLVSAVDLGVPADGTVVTDDVPASIVAAPPAEPSTILTVEPVLPPDPDGAAGGLVGPLDEAVLNPTGSAAPASRAAVDLDPTWEPTAALVASLRDVEAVRVTWPAPAPLVAGLALAGVPLVATGALPDPTRAHLGDALADLLDAGAPALDRDVRSVLLSRAAQDAHAVPAWRTRYAARAGLRAATEPTVSVVLTGGPDVGPDDEAHARAQVARQVGVEVEVVEPGGAPTGDVVLETAADGWWGPEVLRDLLRARRWSGADVVEMPAEVVHAEPIGVTVRRRLATQTYVAGPDTGPDPGTNPGSPVPGLVLVDRALAGLDAAGRRAAGATTYRTHGLAHVARLRHPDGVAALLKREHVVAQWRGLHLGPLAGPEQQRSNA